MNWALRPLVRLRNDIRTRRPDDLTPLDATRVPSEVAPLVEAVNHHIARHRRVLDEQSQFLADASHQLRTPLAIMLTQAQYALRERDPVRAQEGLRAIVDQLGRTRCLTEQLLSLAHASQADAPPRQELDLNDVARDVVLQYLPLAHEKQQDLGWVDARGDEAEGASDTAVVPVWGSEVELHEALSNLVHNAINYARRGAHHGIGRALPRPRRGAGRRRWPRHRAAIARPGVCPVRPHGGRPPCVVVGSGLGLSIARAYARRNDGDIELRDGEPNAQGGIGLCAVFWIPLYDQSAPADEAEAFRRSG